MVLLQSMYHYILKGKRKLGFRGMRQGCRGRFQSDDLMGSTGARGGGVGMGVRLGEGCGSTAINVSLYTEGEMQARNQRNEARVQGEVPE